MGYAQAGAGSQALTTRQPGRGALHRCDNGSPRAAERVTFHCDADLMKTLLLVPLDGVVTRKGKFVIERFHLGPRKT